MWPAGSAPNGRGVHANLMDTPFTNGLSHNEHCCNTNGLGLSLAREVDSQASQPEKGAAHGYGSLGATIARV